MIAMTVRADDELDLRLTARGGATRDDVFGDPRDLLGPGTDAAAIEQHVSRAGAFPKSQEKAVAEPDVVHADGKLGHGQSPLCRERSAIRAFIRSSNCFLLM